MKIRNILLATAAAAVASSAFALTPEHTAWGKGPAAVLMTKDEAAQWKAISTDDAAEKFIALFWARRDPTPGTPRNEFHEDFDARVQAADANFAEGKTKGSMTDRGKALILYGQPTKLEHAGAALTAPHTGTTASDVEDEKQGAEVFIWTYEGDATKSIFTAPRTQLRFFDRLGRHEFHIERSLDIGGSQQRAIAAAIKQPNLTEVPSFEAPKQQPAPVPIAEVVPNPPAQTELTTDALKAAVADFKKSGKSAKPIYATTGEYLTGEGVDFAPVLVYIPKDSSPAANATFFGVVEDASGKNVLAFEEAAKPVATKDDFFLDKSLALPPGKYRGYFGISDGGKVSLVASDLELAGITKDAAGASQLLLANNIYPLSAAQAPTDPYAFGGLKVVPKGDRTFHSSDDLWYFVELRNPGIAEGATEPKVQVKLDVEGTDATGKKTKMTAPPMEVPATQIKGVPGHFAIGSSIPLQTFKPGDYTFTAKVIDTVNKNSYTFKETFKVVE
jgi:GWxTD domain-containing protein